MFTLLQQVVSCYTTLNVTLVHYPPVLCLFQPPLVKAIFTGDVEEVQLLLGQKEDVNFQDSEKRSPLHAAAFRGDPCIVEALILSGARVNTKDSKWLTPLHRACCSGSEVSCVMSLSVCLQQICSINLHWKVFRQINCDLCLAIMTPAFY